jgi:trehalose 6-phosphate synthase
MDKLECEAESGRTRPPVRSTTDLDATAHGHLSGDGDSFTNADTLIHVETSEASPTGLLLAELRELHLRAGEPSTRRIADGIGKLVSHTTVHGMLRSTKLPRLEHLLPVVTWLGGDPERFRELWLAARRGGKNALTASVEPVSVRSVAPVPTGDSIRIGRGSARRHDFVLASYRLPQVRVLERPARERRDSTMMHTLDLVLADVALRHNCGWVGWNQGRDEPHEPDTAGSVTRYPIMLTPQEVKDHYEGYANSTLWPLYHDVIEPPRFEPAWARANITVNERFAEMIEAVAAPGATVWIHDYHLQLLPAMLRRRRKDLRIGFFLHIPWPPIELFSRTPDRIALLRGLLGADLIGFQSRLAVDNFLNAVRHLLDLRPNGTTLRVGGRRVTAKNFPISVDTGAIERFASTDTVLDEAARLRNDLGRPRTVLLGVDRLDYTKGIEQRLRAYQELLDERRVARSTVTLIQLVTPSRETIAHYGSLRERVDRAVGSINARYGRVGSPVVHYAQREHSRNEIMALYRTADVMLVTPYRDGMNLVAKEYVASRSDNRGTMVLSEFAGAAAELPDAVIVNPYDLTALKDAIVTAIEMGGDEQTRRMAAMRQHLQEHDLSRWTSTFLAALRASEAAATLTASQ